MIIKEYRVILPISVEEYQVAQLYSTAVASKIETGGGQGVEVLTNEPYDKDGETGQYTHKIYHMNNLPKLITFFSQKSTLFHEKAWNAYPYCQTMVTNECMKENFLIKVETWHKPDMGEVDNVYGLTEEEWNRVEVVHINIADRSQIPRADYNPEADPAIFESEKTGRGPLGPDWKNEVSSDINCPHMCVYKLVKVRVKVLGFQKKTEEYLHTAQRRIFTLFHRQLFCWIDKWIDLTMDDIRRLEDEIKNDLNQIMENCEYTGMGLGD